MLMIHSFSFDYERYHSLADLSGADAELLRHAREACNTAFAPYSNFRVGAAALLESGAIITGSNQESEVFPAGVCAERCLLFHHQAHLTEDRIVALAVVSVPGARECYPCGICRQVLCDTEKRQGMPIRIIMAGDTSATAIDTASRLLPFRFEL